MSQLRRTQKIDPEILGSSDRILDDILERLGLSLHVADSGDDERREREIDQEVAGLRGSLYPGLPTGEIPLETFRVDDDGGRAPREPTAPSPVSRPRIDSFAPISVGSSHPPPPALSPASTSPEPERGRTWRTAPWVLGYAVAAGLAGFVATGAVVRAREAARPAAGQALAAAHRVTDASTPAPVVLVQDPAPAAETAGRPGRVIGAAPVSAAPRSAPRPAAVAARGAAPAPAPEPRAAGRPAAADPADLPLVLPPPPPKPQVAFDRAGAAVAIAGSGVRAASCREAGAGSMAVKVRVTFAPSGSAVGAEVTGGPLLGTSAGRCVAAALRGARVPAFDGEPVAVSTVVHLR